MKIALINGSPKMQRSASATLLEELQLSISETAEVTETALHTSDISEDVWEKLKSADVWVFSYPLYVDGIPGHLLSCLMQLEKEKWQEKEIRVYGIVNCGFYEGIQAEFALTLLKNWCEKCGFLYAGGIGVGGGGGLAQMPKVQGGHGPRAPIEKALQAMAVSILQQKTQENRYVSVAFPRFLYRMAAQTGWRRWIKANGGKAKDLGKKPE
ncbi:MAG: NAD(P)H-dependent oxidoreductase [Lachnospiraceae bacterium]|nr:NAD(P)H-dependent oxidoreductase [Lachnospiraceae bacterium]